MDNVYFCRRGSFPKIKETMQPNPGWGTMVTFSMRAVTVSADAELFACIVVEALGFRRILLPPQILGCSSASSGTR